ncbi:MAG TPA: DmsE family decaheme c-type cytochrome, partial [Bryobacteraceae bacterium]|nr:DmsE family decaheme c-type cytochrome [Bryobacteraceae bacterium]
MKMNVRGPVLLAAAASIIAAAPQQHNRAQEPRYVGSAACSQCHPLTRTFFRNPHNVLMSEKKPERTGCESCHGPASGHVEYQRSVLAGKPGDSNLNTIFGFSETKTAEAMDRCLECHSQQLSRSQIRRSEHTLAGIRCNSCHSIHASATPKYLLPRTQAQLCYNCHPGVRAQFNMPFKHRVNEGFMTCTDCHNPHGAMAPVSRMGVRPRMVESTASGEQPCLRCHVDLRGPFLFEHAAVRVDGCESCHGPASGHVEYQRSVLAGKPGDSNLNIIFGFSEMKPAEAMDRCLA